MCTDNKNDAEKCGELAAVFANMVEAVIVIKESGIVTNLNQSAERLLHLPHGKAKGNHFSEVIHNIELHYFVQEIFQSHSPVEKEILFMSEHLGQLFLQVHGVLIRDEEFDVPRALMVFNDVTKLRKLESIRSDFVANVSHELKTPITTIKGFIETLRDGAVEDPYETMHFLDIMQKNADRLHSIVEDLLTLSRVEDDDKHARIPLRYESIAKPLEAAIETCSLRALKKGIRFNFHCPDTILVKMNAPLLEQAVSNLVVNAIKYSDDNKMIFLHVDVDENYVHIKVKDNGIGIPREHLPRLFERFYRSDKARSRKLGGTGLGLAIVKHIVSAHHGEVEVESEVGQGSVFTIKLPLKEPETVEPA